MVDKIIKDAGFQIIRTEDRDCLLRCVEALQLERDRYRDLFTGLIAPNEMAEEHF